MVKKGLLLVRTVRHLKLKQIVYQVYYRLKRKHGLGHYTPKSTGEVNFKSVDFTIDDTVLGLASGDNAFTFLNLPYKFGAVVDWDYQQYGKLWNYNLQYFHFLQQTDIPVTQKKEWLLDIGSWLKAGKLKLEPYPVSLRAINTMRFLSTNQVADQTIVDDLFGQLAYLYYNIEYHLLGNHLLENAFALAMGGYVFNVDSWTNTAKSILYEQLGEQTLNDGGHFELSPMYHQIILFRVLELIDWYKKIEKPDADFLLFITGTAAEMVTWLHNVTFKNGDIPHFNDSATGVALTSAELFAFASQLNIRQEQLKLDGSGYRKYALPVYECVVDVGPVGPSYQPGHSHADALSFVLHCGNQPIIVDAGTSTYQIGQRRSYERSTNAHNTVEINGTNQSEVWGGFRVGRRAHVDISKDTATELIAQHNGYQKKYSAVHQRNFTFAADNITIRDIISGSEKLIAKALFHFDPSCTPKLANNAEVHIDNIATLLFTGAAKLDLQEYTMANGYNKYSSAICLTVEFTGELQTKIIFL